MQHKGVDNDGHYIAYVRYLKDMEIEQWFECDDKISKRVFEPDLDSATSTLLFYVMEDAKKKLPNNSENFREYTCDLIKWNINQEDEYE